MTQEYASRGYLLDDFRLFHLSDAQGAKVDYHYHEFCKLLLLRSGSGGYMVEGRRYSLKPGDIVLIGHHTVHRPEFEPGIPYERIIFYISPEFLRRSSDETCELEAVFFGDRGHVLRLEGEVQDRLFDLAARLERELSGQAPGREILSGALLLNLLVEILRARQSLDSQMPRPAAPRNGRVQDILRHIDAHLSEDITIDSLAEEFYISKYHMMRLFRREVGQSIHAYLLDRRLFHARELIRSGLSATESAFRSGFRSYSSFTRAYGKRFGATPTGRQPQPEEMYE